jgi:hypothetical protein
MSHLLSPPWFFLQLISIVFLSVDGFLCACMSVCVCMYVLARWMDVGACAETNVDGDDPDITGDLIRFHKLTNWQGRHKYQVCSCVCVHACVLMRVC